MSDACPACGRPMNGKILVCEPCWFKVPKPDRALFRGMWVRSGGRMKCCQSKADQIVRDLKGPSTK